jgi:hypothetical protein
MAAHYQQRTVGRALTKRRTLRMAIRWLNLRDAAVAHRISVRAQVGLSLLALSTLRCMIDRTIVGGAQTWHFALMCRSELRSDLEQPSSKPALDIGRPLRD